MALTDIFTKKLSILKLESDKEKLYGIDGKPKESFLHTLDEAIRAMIIKRSILLLTKGE